MPTVFERDPNKEYITKGGALIPKVKPPTTAFETITETVPEVAAVQGSPAEKRSLLGIDWLLKDKPAVEAVKGHGPQRITRRVPVVTIAPTTATTAPAPQAAPVAAAPAPAPAQEVIRITKDGKRAVFDSATKRFLRYAD